MNILITAASRKVSLVKYFSKGLKSRDNSFKVFTTDTNPLSPALYFSDKHFIVPMSNSEEYIPTIKNICRDEGISLVLPTIDEELPIFGRHKGDFQRDGITVLVSNEQTCNICNDKYLTYKHFVKEGIPTPDTFLPREIDYKRIRYPLIVKPRFGRGSINVYKAYNENDLRFFIGYIEDPIIQTAISGREFTIDTLSDLNGTPLSVVPRERLVVRAGITDKGRTVKDDNLIKYGIAIIKGLNIAGPSNIQCIMGEDGIKFIEINPRFSGGIQLTISAGADFTDLIIRLMRKETISPSIGIFEEGLTMLSYEDSIYIKPAT